MSDLDGDSHGCPGRAKLPRFYLYKHGPLSRHLQSGLLTHPFASRRLLFVIHLLAIARAGLERFAV